MGWLKSKVSKFVEDKDCKGLGKLLAGNPDLANKGITIPYAVHCRIKEHPLHRLCDAVFSKKMTDEEAIGLAQVFLKWGAFIDGDMMKGRGTPILAAASLHAERLGIFYIDNGANVHYTYQGNGESALHWASFCGRNLLVDRLIKANAAIDEPDLSHRNTPLGWAIFSLKSRDVSNTHCQVECIKQLLANGAEVQKLDGEKYAFLRTLANNDLELLTLLNRKSTGPA